jgi:hypothetical protein
MWESKVAPLSGVFFGLILVAAFLVDPNTDFMPSEAERMAHLQAGPGRIMIAAYLTILAAVALVWFSGSVYKWLHAADDDGARLSLIAVGGGVLASALTAVGGVATLAAAERLSITDAIDPGVAASLLDVTSIAIGNGAPLGLGALIGACGVVMLRGGRVPSWMGWVSVLIALGLISPVGWAVLAVAIVWVAWLGLWLYRMESVATPVGVS